MAQLALKAVHWGAEKIPDKAFHAVPGGYFRPPEIDEQKRKKREKKKKEKEERKKIRKKLEGKDDKEDEESNSDSSDPSDEEETKDTKPRRKERPRRSRNSSYLDRGYESDQGPANENYFPPPPLQPFSPTQSAYSPRQSATTSPRQSTAQPAAYPAYKPYNPADYPGPPTQQDWDLTSRMEQARIYDPQPQAEPRASDEAGPGTTGQTEQPDNFYHPPAYDPVFPNLPAQGQSSSTPSTIDPVFSPTPTKLSNPSASPKAAPMDREPSTSPSPNFVPAETPIAVQKDREASTSPAFNSDYLGNAANDRKPSTAQAKYTPSNYTSSDYAPSPPFQPQGSTRGIYQPSDERFRTPSPQQKSFSPAPSVQSPYPVPIPMPIPPQPQQPVYPIYPAYPAAVGPYDPPVDQEDYPYDGSFSPRNDQRYHDRAYRDYSPRPSRRSYNSYSDPPSPRPRSKGRPRDRDSDDDKSSKPRSQSRSSRIKDTLKEHKDVGAAALGALAGGLIGHEVGHGRTMGTVLGTTIGGFGANFAEKRWRGRRRRIGGGKRAGV